MADTDDDDFKERRHFASVVQAFLRYGAWAAARIDRIEADYRRLSVAHQRLLKIDEKVHRMRHAVQQNMELIERMVGPHRSHVGALEEENLANASLSHVSESDMDKVQSTLKQFVREWGAEGAKEREAAQAPLLDALERAAPGGAVRGMRVLVPGSGLGRLAWEVARRGFQAQASEFSYFMLIASNFILNNLQPHGTISMHPWVLQTCNVKSLDDQVRACAVPDVEPWSLPLAANLSMCAGDFLEVYREHHAQWEVLLSQFFIDTAHNIVEYIDAIRRLLVPGGAWVNFGPLLWHFTDMRSEVSVDLTWAEVRTLITDAGFILEHEAWHRCPYVRNVRSMYMMEYDCICFIARW